MGQFRRFTGLTLTLSASLLAQARVAPRVTEAVDEDRLIPLKGNTHALARPEYRRGIAPSELPMERMLLVLKRSPEQQKELDRLLQEQQSESSPGYHKWLTPEEFGQRFGPADSDIQAVTAWLRSHGFRTEAVSKGRALIEFSGTAGQVREAFHTAIHRFVIGDGREHWANAADPQIPAALAPVVGGVASIHNFHSRSFARRTGRKVKAASNAGFPLLNSTEGDHYLAPGDYAVIYNINPVYGAGIKGKGVTIAVVGRSNFDLQNVKDFRARFNLSNNPPKIIVNGPDPGNLHGDEEAEAVLDATWAGAVAPEATVKFIVSPNTNATDAVDLSEQYIVDNNLGDIITESFGQCEYWAGQAQKDALESIREQAAAQGMTFVVSAGDSGPYVCDDFTTELVVSGPASVNLRAASPWVVAAGGTQFNEQGKDSSYWLATEKLPGYTSARSYIPEEAWNQSCHSSECFPNIVAGSGGPSATFGKPWWQNGVAGIPADKARDLPDISLAAAWDHDPYVLCLEGLCQLDSNGGFSFEGVGGTSAAAPSLAGIMALIGQKMGARLGPPNYLLYRLASKERSAQCNGSAATPPAGTCVFHDITVGNNAVPLEPGYGTSSAHYRATAGYDLATGLGSVNVANLLNKWSSITFAPTDTALSVTPASLVHGAAAAVAVTVTPRSGRGTPSGKVALVTSTHLGVDELSLANGTASTNIGKLPGGTYEVSAHYAGDGSYSPSDSPPVALTVSPEPSNVQASALIMDTQGHTRPFSAGPYGSNLALSAGVAGVSGFGTPTGGILFLDNGTRVGRGIYNLSSDGAVLKPLTGMTPAAGTHAITALYTGDASFMPAGLSDLSFVIQKAPTTITIAPRCAVEGQTMIISADVNTFSIGDPPTGTISFSSAGQPLGAPARVGGALYDQNGYVRAITSFPTSALNQARNSVTATYSGDGNYLESSVTASVLGPQSTCVGGVVNGATYKSAVAQDSFVSIFGAALATESKTGGSTPLPVTLSGTSVTFRDSAGHQAPAPLAYISPRQINCVVPAGLEAGDATIQVTSPAGSDQIPITIGNVAPGIFTAAASSVGPAAGQIVRVKEDGTQSFEPTSIVGATGNISAKPIAFRGDRLILVLYGTGLRHRSDLANVQVFVNFQGLIPAYAGSQNLFQGVDQVNVELPSVLEGSGWAVVDVMVDGQISNTVILDFQ